MAVRTREEIMTAVRGRIGENVDDDTLALLEDIDDTLKSVETAAGGENWEEKYRALDQEWRQRYRDRFFSQGEQGDGTIETEHMPDEPEAEPEGPTTFEELFTVKEG